jgi:pimeloyl-ACP methyl ester carboxylesterase
VEVFIERLWELNGLKLRIAEGPKHGPPLVLLHGVVRQWTDFAPLWPALSARWSIYAVDFRGHGGSDRAGTGYRVVDYVGDIVALLDRFDEPAAIYGHSLGAMVALAAAAARPDRMRALVLEDPPFHTMGRDIAGTPYHSQFAGMERIVRPGRSAAELRAELAALPIRVPGAAAEVPLGRLRDAAALRYMAHCLERLDPRVLAPIAAGQWLDGYDGPALAAQTVCPTLVLEADTAVAGMLRPEDTQWLLENLADGAVVRFPGVGHLLHWQATDAVLRATLAWLEAARDGRADVNGGNL